MAQVEISVLKKLFLLLLLLFLSGGKATFDYVKGGGGSGDVTVAYTRNLYQGFKEKAGHVEVFEEIYRHFAIIFLYRIRLFLLRLSAGNYIIIIGTSHQQQTQEVYHI